MPWNIELIPEAEAELLALPPDMRARFLHIVTDRHIRAIS